MRLKFFWIIFLIFTIFSCTKKIERAEDAGNVFLENIFEKDISEAYAMLSPKAQKTVNNEMFKNYLENVFNQNHSDQVLNYEKKIRKISIEDVRQDNETKFSVKYNLTLLEPWVVAAYIYKNDKKLTLEEFVKQEIDSEAKTIHTIKLRLFIVKQGDQFYIDENAIIEDKLDKIEIFGKITRPQDVK